ncbi:ATP-binding protein [Flaviaesturariibacter amylovorans]|uniref:histidine kinase n=1 Tax=Flaviaesturariibacter amylovorans TaxID=1084520 RepID=A0ABP8HT21_9BACT
MNLKDISNRDLPNLADCASEPIHIPGSIQPHGVLLALDGSGIIRFCSANCAWAFGAEPSGLLQRPLAEVDATLAAAVNEALGRPDPRDKPFPHTAGGRAWEVFAGPADDGSVLVELECCHVPTVNDAELFDQTRDFIGHIERSRDLQELCGRIAAQVQAITGFDRVMIYRFDPEYNGEVYAESKVADIEPFHGLYYPNTDIPPQARELYLRNLMRAINDVHYEPVPILTAGNGDHASLDLSDALLRSVSPIHIQYLKNMGVGATLTISLVLEGRLWGLIACHHHGPLHLVHRQRQAALMQGHFLTSQIRVRQVAEEYGIYTVVEAHLQQLLNALQQEGDFPSRFRSFSSLMALTHASGVALLHQGQLHEMGLVPGRDRLRALFQWLAQGKGQQFVTSHLAAHYPDAAKITREASGVLYMRLGDPKKDAIIWFREEFERTIRWAGDPREAVKRSPVTNMLTPRSSFAQYKEQVRGHSREWRYSETNAAARFAGALQNQVHLEYLRAEEASQRLLNEKLVKANNELANINWITTHDLKEPIRKIQVFASKVMGSDEVQLSESLLNALSKIQGSAQRMRQLVDDIMSYSLTDDPAEAHVPTDLNGIIAEVIDAFEDELREKGGRLESTPLPTVPAVPYQMRQLFTNLVGNALKFAKPGLAPEVRIDCSLAAPGTFHLPLLDRAQPYYRIRVQDNGIGFREEQQERIFNIFYRLHDKEAYAGTGIGLAICKRIAENHGGIITARGAEGEGAEFEIYLPADRRE